MGRKKKQPEPFVDVIPADSELGRLLAGTMRTPKEIEEDNAELQQMRAQGKTPWQIQQRADEKRALRAANRQQQKIAQEEEPAAATETTDTMQPGPSEERGRERSEDGSTSGRDDIKRQAVETDNSSDEMAVEVLEASNITQTTSSAADPSQQNADTTSEHQGESISTTDRYTADPAIQSPDRLLADLKQRYRDLMQLYRDIQQGMEGMASLISQLESQTTRSPPHAEPTSSRQTDPPMQQYEPARQQPQPTPQPSVPPSRMASSSPPSQPPRPPKQPPKVFSPPGGRSASFAAGAGGAAAGAAAPAAAASQPSRRNLPSATRGRYSHAIDPPPSSFAATLHVRDKFVFKAPLGTLPDSAASLKDRLKSFLEVRLHGAHLPITDAVFFGSQATSTRVYFTLESLEAADHLVGGRSALKDSGTSIQDFLTPEELKLKRSLWPRFLEARARGQRPQFHRARLVVS